LLYARNIGELITLAAAELASSGVEHSRIDAELLLGFCLNKSRTALYLAAQEPVSEKKKAEFTALLSRRKKREPLAYITGEREFWSLPFDVSPAVLIPRPETEFLLETVFAQRSRNVKKPLHLDLCCGSGVISIILALELKIPVWAIDISARALVIARKNSRKHAVSDLVRLIQSDLFNCFNGQQQFSLIISNPPYVKHSDITLSLDPEVASYEPHKALDGGINGLEIISRIRDQLPVMLAPGGDCFIEIGDSQGEAVRSLFLESESGQLYEFVSIYKDYSGRDRVAHIRRTHR